MDVMLGSYGPSKPGEPYTKRFDTDESPSGMLARSGTYHVRSRITDDDGKVYLGEHAFSCQEAPCRLTCLTLWLLDWEWSFKLAKEW